MSVLVSENQTQVEKFLVEDGLIASADLKKYRDEAVKKKQPLMAYLLENNIINDEQLTKAIAKVAKIPYVNLSQTVVKADILKLLSREFAERFLAVPLGEMDDRLVVAMLDADNVQAVDFLSSKIGRPLKVYMASEQGIQHVIGQYRADLASVTALEEEQSRKDMEETKGSKKPEADINTIVADSPVSKALSTILEYAVTSRASDIHIEPLEGDVKIRCRVDGVLREIMRLPKSVEPALISRIKILARLKIDEHRKPQDGEFVIKVSGREVDLRIAISPVVWGEQVVIRILDKTGMSLKLEDLGYTGRALRLIREGLAKPNGMILTSGPTGSGKSTLLYSLIQEIATDAINIVTLEDPVEYKMSGVNQIQVNVEVGLTFASGLRSILRQDPDVVMVGEMRDHETARLGVQAALTGHLVFSTLHTNSASGVLPRLLDMEIEPFLIASTVNTIIGQRLVRKIAEKRESFTTDEKTTKTINDTVGYLLPKNKEEVDKVSRELGYEGLPLAGQKAYTLYKGVSDSQTPDGYKGRIGLYEVFDINEEIEKLILKRSTTTEIQNLARKQGMITMREDGYLKALSGLTTLEEVNRVAAPDSA